MADVPPGHLSRKPFTDSLPKGREGGGGEGGGRERKEGREGKKKLASQGWNSDQKDSSLFFQQKKQSGKEKKKALKGPLTEGFNHRLKFLTSRSIISREDSLPDGHIL